jgi:hypothetical protein
MATRKKLGEIYAISVSQRGDKVTCDYYATPRNEAGQAFRPAQHRRVIVTCTIELDRGQLAHLGARMAQYVVHTQRGSKAVPRGLPWWEVGVTDQPVPPGGGEGGEMAGQLVMIDRSGDVVMDPPALPSAAGPARQARKRREAAPVESVDVDLP